MTQSRTRTTSHTRTRFSLPWIPLLASLLALLLGGLLPVPSRATRGFDADGGSPVYDAQRKPRVTVLEFTDTNQKAQAQEFGRSVSAMLVTHLKNESQFVVVERQDLKEVLSEWERNQGGLTKVPLDQLAPELLEYIDVFIAGKVTVLQGSQEGPGPWIEVDAKLLSREDGRILAAVERAGREACLREVVERLGSAMERDFLRPHAGHLKLSLRHPAQARFYLTPILRTDHGEEEKPPVELGSTTIFGEDRDEVEAWVTNPTSHVIRDLLSGWYTLRIERPGYDPAEVDNDSFRVWVRDGRAVLLYGREGHRKPVSRMPADAPWRKHLVHVEALRTSQLDLTALGHTLRKKTGSIQLSVVDQASRPLPGARVLVRSIDLDINRGSPDAVRYQQEAKHGPSAEEPKPEPDAAQEALLRALARGRDAARRAPEGTSDPRATTGRDRRRGSGADPAADPEDEGESEGDEGDGPAPPRPCQLVVQRRLPSSPAGGQVVRSETFSVRHFDGGFLAFESYDGEELPTGEYEMLVWAAHHRPVLRRTRVEDHDGEPAAQTLRLSRRSRPVHLRGSSDVDLAFHGRHTGDVRRVSTDPTRPSTTVELPIDVYDVEADLPTFPAGARRLDLLPPGEAAPRLDEVFASWRATLPELVEPEPFDLPVKDRLWVGGRLKHFLPIPGAFWDGQLAELLDELLGVSRARRQLSRLMGNETSLEAFARRLQAIDLLILDQADMGRLLVLPDAARVIRAWVDQGHALVVFVTEPGRYGSLLGAPLEVRGWPTYSSQLKLSPGLLRDLRLRKKILLEDSRRLPKVRRKDDALAGWRVLAYGNKKRTPRILERGGGGQGGYVLVWLDSSNLRARATAEATGGGIAGFLRSLWNPSADPSLQRARRSEEQAEAEARRIASAIELAQQAEAIEEPEIRRALEEMIVELVQAPPSPRTPVSRKARERELERREANDRLLLFRTRLLNRAVEAARRLFHDRLGDPGQRLASPTLDPGRVAERSGAGAPPQQPR